MTFADLNLSNPILNALADAQLETPTEIQEKAFSTIMSGRDVVGIAQTGTGKTIAYLLPLLRMWKFVKDPHPRILILVPTRELTLQVKAEVEKLTTYMNVTTVAVYGGVNLTKQAIEVLEGCDIVVATPGRLLDLLYNKAINHKYIKKLVIDEVDYMLELGFRTQLKNILDIISGKRQSLLFSATLTDDVSRLLDDFFKNPVRITSAESGMPLENITQTRYSVPNFNTKINLFEKMVLNVEQFVKVIVFVNTKKMADMLYDRLNELCEEPIGIIHSNKSQNNRLKTVEAFDLGEFQILIATDILARGIDLSKVSHVINFEIPEEAESYIHRIGRTGRAEETGRTISFVTPAEEASIEKIEKLMDFSIPIHEMPEGVVKSSILLPQEEEVVSMPNLQLKNPINRDSRGAFHEKAKKRGPELDARQARMEKQKKRRDAMNKKKPKFKRGGK